MLEVFRNLPYFLRNLNEVRMGALWLSGEELSRLRR